MVPTTVIKNWTSYYAQNRNDEGAIQTLFRETMGTLATTTTTHLGNTNKLTQTIARTGHGNMMVVPGPPGTMFLLHHGFTCKVPEGFALIFVQGNLSDCAVFKILPMEEVTKPIEGTTSGRASTRQGIILECPTLDKMIESKTEEEFKKLPASGNEVLKGKPNHLLILPEVFFMANGNKSFSSKWMAIQIIERLRPQESDDANMTTARKNEAKLLETLLALLWASENKGLVPINLADLPDESHILNQMVRNVKVKVIGMEAQRETGPGEPGISAAGTAAMTLTSQTMIMALNKDLATTTKRERRRSRLYLRTWDRHNRNSWPICVPLTWVRRRHNRNS